MSLSSFTTLASPPNLDSYAASFTISPTLASATSTTYSLLWERGKDAVAIVTSTSTEVVTATATPAQVQDLGACFPQQDALQHLVPPCVELEVLERECEPRNNNPGSTDIIWHADCMCNGPFFEKWRGCQNCLHVHGFHDENDRDFWDLVLGRASYSLCVATPTAPFRDIFWSAHEFYDGPFPTAGNTELVDRFPGDAAVTNYYTPYDSDWIFESSPESTTVDAEPESETGSALETSSKYNSSTIPTKTYRLFPYILSDDSMTESSTQSPTEGPAPSSSSVTADPQLQDRDSGSTNLVFSLLALSFCLAMAAF